MKNEYKQYLFAKIGSFMPKYSQLIEWLFTRPFYYILPRDANLYEDGISLRYHFGVSRRIDQASISYEIDISPCSMLEMMVALCEKLDNITHTEDFGVEDWFKIMLESTEYNGLSNGYFNEVAAEAITQRFEHRQFDGQNGLGSLFWTEKGYDEDVTNIDIWRQAMRYCEKM